MADTRVFWKQGDLWVRVRKASDYMLNTLAKETAKTLKREIVRRDLRRTGFMLNAVYYVSPIEDTYGETWQTSHYYDRKSRRRVNRTQSPRAHVPDNEAYVGVAAQYFIYIESKHRILYYAMSEAAKRADEMIEQDVRRAAK